MFRIEVDCQPETDVDYREDLEPDDVKWVTSELEAGNTWAWCIVRVSLVFDDDFQVDGYLCACSYESKQNFIESSGYYDDMVEANKQKVRDAYQQLYT